MLHYIYIYTKRVTIFRGRYQRARDARSGVVSFKLFIERDISRSVMKLRCARAIGNDFMIYFYFSKQPRERKIESNGE